MRCTVVAIAALALLAPATARGDGPAAAPADAGPVLAAYGAGAGPAVRGTTVALLDDARTPGQTNTAAWPRAAAGAFERWRLTARLTVLEGGDGGALAWLPTARYGVRGPAPALPSWVEPNLPGVFAVAFDVHNPKHEEMFTPWGNYQDLPQREVALHLDGREVVKRVAPVEFRGAPADVAVDVEFVPGGAEVTVTVAGAKVYDRWFVAEAVPYEARVAVGASTRADATTKFDVDGLVASFDAPATPRPPSVRFEAFHHVRSDARRQAFDATLDLPPRAWAFARVLCTVELHDAGDAWDEWDRVGAVSVLADDGTAFAIVPFITSYRTPCRWVVDVTAFRPWLAGRRTLRVAAGTDFYKGRGFLMSVTLDFVPGPVALEPSLVVPLWVGEAAYRSDEHRYRDFFVPRDVDVPADAAAVRFRATVTGHSQVGEFTPSTRTLLVGPKDAPPTARFPSPLWKADVYLNPNRPQAGTWQFSRAGWAPGDVVAPWVEDLTAAAPPGRTVTVQYEADPYTFPAGEPRPPAEEVAAARQVVNACLVVYRRPTDLVTPPTLRVLDVVAGGNAAAAGVRPGDWLASYDGRDVATPDALRAAVKAAATPGREAVPAVLWRGAERLDVTLKPGLLGVHLSPR